MWRARLQAHERVCVWYVIMKCVYLVMFCMVNAVVMFCMVNAVVMFCMVNAVVMFCMVNAVCAGVFREVL